MIAPLGKIPLESAIPGVGELDLPLPSHLLMPVQKRAHSFFICQNACQIKTLSLSLIVSPPAQERAHSFFDASIIALPPALDGRLVPFDHSTLWCEKHEAHLVGTREWAFAEVDAWREDKDAAQLFWLVGSGGTGAPSRIYTHAPPPRPCYLPSGNACLHCCTGKSVLSAELLRRNTAGWRAAAWHFCRHDDAAKSEPCALMRSLAGMLCTTVAGYEASLIHVTNLDEAFASTDPKVVFQALFVEPLKHVVVTDTLFLLIDALDEIPKEWQKALLRVIATMLEQLPKWLRVFTTSRDEPAIRAELARFRPKELRADEAKQRLDVEVFLRKIARKHVKGQVNAEEIEADVKRRYGIDMGGKLAVLQQPMEASRAIYGKVRDSLSKADGFPGLLNVLENRNPDLVQVEDNFDIVFFEQAPKAQEKLKALIADEWVVDPDEATLRHPVPGKQREWVEMADDPGVKGEDRSREKMANDYAGHANKLKDLARLTLRFKACKGMLAALESKLAAAGIKVLSLKNKYASPTPMGYSDFNLCVGVQLDDGKEYVCEMQLNLVEMLDAKREAHVHYEKVRELLPKLCEGTKVDANELEGYIVGRLSTSALDSAVESLSQKADGLFLYAFLLAKHLDAEAAAGRTVDFASLDSLPAGLGEVYATNFKRAFPAGTADPAWCAALPLIEVIVAAQEPLAQPMVRELLGLEDSGQKRHGRSRVLSHWRFGVYREDVSLWDFGLLLRCG